MWGARDGQVFSQGLMPGDGQTVYSPARWRGTPITMSSAKATPGPRRKNVSENLETVLGTVGGRLEDIVSQTIYFVNRDDLAEIREVRAERLRYEEGARPSAF